MKGQADLSKNHSSSEFGLLAVCLELGLIKTDLSPVLENQSSPGKRIPATSTDPTGGKFISLTSWRQRADLREVPGVLNALDHCQIFGASRANSNSDVGTLPRD